MSARIIGADVLGDAKRYFEAAPEIATTAARLAINQTAERGGMKLLRASIEEEVAFPAGYLGRADRLFIRKKAYNRDLEAIIAARQRPTSLARFARGAVAATGKRTGGVSVMVKPGSTKRMPKAFLMRLRAGATLSDSNYNLGLAIRLKPGEHIRGKRKQSPVQLGHNLYLLYGPSVDQVFRSVAADDAPQIGEMVQDEFFRQFTRLSEAI